MRPADYAVIVLAAASVCLILSFTILLMRLQKALAESNEALSQARRELAPLLKEAREAISQASGLLEEVRGGVAEVSVLFKATGDLGRSLQRAQQYLWVRKDWLAKAVAIGAGLRAVSSAWRGRNAARQQGATRKERSVGNGI